MMNRKIGLAFWDDDRFPLAMPFHPRTFSQERFAANPMTLHCFIADKIDWLYHPLGNEVISQYPFVSRER
jgi:hypothetical protein